MATVQKGNNKLKKFKPRKQSRYLPGEIPPEQAKFDLMEYNTHLFNVFSATPKVDDSPPKFHFDKYFGLSKMEAQVNALRQIEVDNKKLLIRINTINRTTGITDTFNHHANVHCSKWDINCQKFKRIHKDNKELHQKILETEAAYPKSEHDEFWKKTIHKLKTFSKYPLVILNQTTKDQLLKQCPSINEGLDAGEEDTVPKDIIKRPKCFLEIKIDNGIVLGKVIVELYNDIVPETVAHFMKLCTSRTKRSFRNCPISKIFINKYCIAGDPTNYKSKGASIEIENFELQHARPGVISMIPNGENNVINSQFCISLIALPEFNNKYVVIGKIVKGAINLFKLGEFGQWHGKPITKMVISDCGIYEKNKNEIQKLTSNKKGHH